MTTVNVSRDEALAEAVEYLDSNKLNSIGAGSILHRKMKQALASAEQCIACEGRPSGDNVPCAVCGKAEQPSIGVDLASGSDWSGEYPIPEKPEQPSEGDVGRDVKASSECSLCGLDIPHHHSEQEIAKLSRMDWTGNRAKQLLRKLLNLNVFGDGWYCGYCRRRSGHDDTCLVAEAETFIEGHPPIDLLATTSPQEAVGDREPSHYYCEKRGRAVTLHEYTRDLSRVDQLLVRGYEVTELFTRRDLEAVAPPANDEAVRLLGIVRKWPRFVMADSTEATETRREASDHVSMIDAFLNAQEGK